MSAPRMSPDEKSQYPVTEKGSSHDMEKNEKDGVQTSEVIVGGLGESCDYRYLDSD